MSGPRITRKLSIVLITLFAMTSPARADAIDGNWCAKDGRHFTIRGATIITPKGTVMDGNYERHAFDYVIPASEPNAGQTAEMILINDDDLSLTTGPEAGERSAAELWHRCKVVS